MSDLEKWRTIGVIRPRTRALNAKDAQLAKDRDAYKRLRMDGHQPPHVGEDLLGRWTGSAALERDATMDLEIAMGRVFPAEEKALAREGQERAEEIGLGKPEAISGF